MTAPKVDTIRRYCDNGLAVEILRERGIITDLEAEAMHARDRRQRDVAYAGIYSTSAQRLVREVLEEISAPEAAIEAATAAITEPIRAGW